MNVTLTDDDMKLYCIEFERELEGVDVIHHKANIVPSTAEAIQLIIVAGYGWNIGYDRVKSIYAVKCES